MGIRSPNVGIKTFIFHTKPYMHTNTPFLDACGVSTLITFTVCHYAFDTRSVRRTPNYCTGSTRRQKLRFVSRTARHEGKLGLAIVPLCRGTGAPPPSTNTGAPWPLRNLLTCALRRKIFSTGTAALIFICKKMQICNVYDYMH